MTKPTSKTVLVLTIFHVVTGLVLSSLCFYFMERFDGDSCPSILPPAGRNLAPEKKTIRFAVVGDNDVFDDGLEKAGAEIRDLNVDFVLCTGDIVRKPQDPRHVNWVAERIREAFGNIHFMATPGNHDREGDDPFDDGIKTYKSVFGQPEYWFGCGDCLFVSLNTSRETLPEHGVQLLEETLRQQRDHFRRLVIFSHVPPIDLRKGKPDCLPKEDAARLESLLQKYAPTLYLCGHHHNFSQWDFAGAKLVTIPSLGQQNRSKTHGNGYLVVTLPEDGAPQFECRDLGELDEFSIDNYLGSKMNLMPLFFALGILLVIVGVTIIGFFMPKGKAAF